MAPHNLSYYYCYYNYYYTRNNAVISVQHLTGDASLAARRIPSATEVFASLNHTCGTSFLGV